jgi:hypothetical protein
MTNQPTTNMGPVVTSPDARLFLYLIRAVVLVTAILSLCIAAQTQMGMTGLVPTLVFFGIVWLISAILRGQR